MRSKRTIREGSVGFLVLLGFGLFIGLVLWLRDVKLGNRTYKIIVEFATAQGLDDGNAVHYRGVTVGKIVALKPASNGVDVTIEINSPSLIMPRDVVVEANKSGLIGEASVAIIPLKPVPRDLLTANPLGPNCSPQIICNDTRLKGQVGTNLDTLIRTTTKVADLYSDPQLLSNLKAVLQKTEKAADGIYKLTEELSGLSQTFKTEVPGLGRSLKKELGDLNQAMQGSVSVLKTSVEQNFGKISDSVDRASTSLEKVADTADITTKELKESALKTTNSATDAANQISITAKKVDELITTNRVTLVATLNNLNQSSQDLQVTIQSLTPIITQVQKGNLINNLEVLTANTAQATANLRDLSIAVNNPTNLLLLQQTLESARTTFGNIQKMTSDIDDLTGDPKFRNSLRNLIKALGNLFGTAQELEKQTSIAQQLAPLEAAFKDPQTVKKISENPSLEWEISNSIPKLQPLVLPSPDESVLLTSPPSAVFLPGRDRF